MKFLILIVLLPFFSLKGQSAFDKKIAEAANQLTCPIPDEKNPVTLNAQLVKEGDSIAIIVKVNMAPGWHIYAYVPSDQPYISIDPILRLPKNIKAIGKWKNTKPSASYTDKGVLLYENVAVFIHKAFITGHSSDRTIQAGLYYQTCNLRQCLPPAEKTFDLKY